MGETYRGLTIRFGGDTSSLQSALRGANAAIASTQTELRKVEQALRFDPSDVVAVGAKMELLKEKSVGVYEKMKQLGNAIEQFGHSTSDIAGIVTAYGNIDKQLAETTKKHDMLTSAAKKTKDAINSMADSLGVGAVFDKYGRQIGDQLSVFEQCSAAASKLASKYRDIAAEYNAVDAQLRSADGTQKQMAQVQKLAAEFVKVQSQARQLRQEFEKLNGVSMFDSAEADRFNSKMREVESSIEAVEDEARRMYSALEIDPTNIEAAKRYLEASADAMGELNSKAKLLSERISSLKSSGIDNVGKSASQVRAEFVRASEELSEWHARIGEAEAGLSSMQTELTKMVTAGKKGTSEYKQMEAAVEQAEASIRDMREAMEAAQQSFDTAQARTELQRLETELTETAAKASKVDDAMRSAGDSVRANASTFTTLGMALSANVTPYLSMAASYAVEAAEEIDAAYRDMRKTVSATEEQFESLKDAAMDFASTHVTSADQIMEIEAMGGQMGLAADELENFATVVANLNVATNISDASEMAEIMGQLSNILGDLSSDTMPQFGDALVRLGNNNAALESDILDVTSRIGSMGSIVGMTTPQLLAWSTAIAATGQNSEAAGTAISNTMSDIEGAVAEGGESLEAFAAVAGESAEEFADKWNGSPSEALQAFVKGLREIDDEGGSVDATLESLGITGVRQKQALEGLTQTVETLDDALEMSQDAWDGVSDEWGEAGDAATEASRKAEGFSGQLSILQNNAQMIGAEFAESLAPALSALNAVMQAAYSTVESMPDGVKQATLAFVALAASIGPVLTVAGPVATVMKTVKGNAATMAKTLGEASKAMASAGSAAVSAKGNLALLAAALAAVAVVAVVDYLNTLREEQAELKEATFGLVSATKSLDASLSGVSASADSASASISGMSFTMSAMKEAVQEQAAMADSMRETWADLGASESLASQYAETIKELAGNCAEGTADVDALKAAVDGYNGITGSAIEVTDEATGAISDENGAIADVSATLDENTRKWVENAEAQAKQEMYADLYRQRYENIRLLNAAQETYNALLAEDTVGMTVEEYRQYNGQLELAAANVEEMTALVEADNEAMEELSGKAEDAAGDVSNLKDAIAGASSVLGVSEDEFKAWAASLGISGAEAMANVADAITAGTPATVAAMEELTGLTQEDFDAMCEDFKVSGEQGMDDFQAAIKAGTPPAVALLKDLTDASDADMKAAAEYMGYAGENGVERFANAVMAGTVPAEEAAAAVRDATDGKLAETEGLAETDGSNAGSAFAGGIAGSSDEAQTAASGVVDDAHSAASDEAGAVDFGSVGGDIVSGIAGGVWGAATSLYAAVRSIVQGALGAAQDEAETGSPSRLFKREVGRWIALGIAEGVDENGDAPVESVRRTVSAMSEAASADVQATVSASLAERLQTQSVTNNNDNSSTYRITLNVTADSSTTLDKLVRQAERAGIAYGRR